MDKKLKKIQRIELLQQKTFRIFEKMIAKLQANLDYLYKLIDKSREEINKHNQIIAESEAQIDRTNKKISKIKSFIE